MRGLAVGEAGFFVSVVLGATVGLYYKDDPRVWHEALVTWTGKGRRRACAILTPDGDRYIEFLAGPEAGPDAAALCGSDGSCKGVPEGQFYRFTHYPGGAELKKLFREGHMMLKEADEEPQNHTKYLDSDGRTMTLGRDLHTFREVPAAIGDVAPGAGPATARAGAAPQWGRWRRGSNRR